MLSHALRGAGPVSRSSTESLVVLFRGSIPVPEIKIKSAVSAAATERAQQSNPNVGAHCEWLNAAGLADDSEASLSYVLGRMAAAMTPHASATESPVRALVHPYSRECQLLVVTTDAGGTHCVDLREVFSQIVAACAEFTGTPGRAVPAEPLPSGGNCGRLFERGRATGRWRTEEAILPALLAAIGVVLALTGAKLVAVDVSLPGFAEAGSCTRIIPLILTSEREPRLKEWVAQARQTLAHGRTRLQDRLHFHVGCVVTHERHFGKGWQCGPLTISGHRLSHFADWDMKVTLSNPEDWTVDVDGGLLPSAITQLLVHAFRCALERPRTLLLDVPLI